VLASVLAAATGPGKRGEGRAAGDGALAICLACVQRRPASSEDVGISLLQRSTTEAACFAGERQRWGWGWSAGRRQPSGQFTIDVQFFFPCQFRIDVQFFLRKPFKNVVGFCYLKIKWNQKLKLSVKNNGFMLLTLQYRYL
jgi:hypothetical protein